MVTPMFSRVDLFNVKIKSDEDGKKRFELYDNGWWWEGDEKWFFTFLCRIFRTTEHGVTEEFLGKIKDEPLEEYIDAINASFVHNDYYAMSGDNRMWVFDKAEYIDDVMYTMGYEDEDTRDKIMKSVFDRINYKDFVNTCNEDLKEVGQKLVDIARDPNIKTLKDYVEKFYDYMTKEGWSKIDEIVSEYINDKVEKYEPKELADVVDDASYFTNPVEIIDAEIKEFVGLKGVLVKDASNIYFLSVQPRYTLTYKIGVFDKVRLI